MPKARASAVMAQTSDAEFRAWVSLCESLLDDSGLVRTADSGQINPATVLRPTVANAAQGYSVWRFADPLQSVAPVFVKVEYGSGTGAANAGCWFTVGRGSDGAGNITDVLMARSQAPNNGNETTAIREFMATHNQWGAALIVGSAGGTIGSQLGFGIVLQRTCASDGTPTADGLLINLPAITNGSTSVGRATFAQFLPTLVVRTPLADSLALLPFGLSDYVVGTSPQVFPTWVALPKVRPMNFFAVGPNAGSPGVGQTFSMAIVGTQARTYINIGGAIGRHFYPQLACTGYIMWEE